MAVHACRQRVFEAFAAHRPFARILAASLFAVLLFAAPFSFPASAATVKIAILEFDALNQTAKAGGWGRTISEYLTTEAVNSGAFEVVERHLLDKVINESMYGDREQGFTSNAQSIANMAGADYVLSGSVRKTNNTLSVQSRLVDVASGAIIAAGNFDSSADSKRLSKETAALMEDYRKRIFGDAPAPKPTQVGAAQVPAGAPLALTVKLAAPGGVDILLKEGDTLTSADGYYLEIATGRQLYVYAGQVDAMGNLYALFPNDAFSAQTNPLPPGTTVRVPGGENFHLDDNTGKETIMVVAGMAPLPAVERVFQRAASADPMAMEDLVLQFQDAVNKAAPELRQTIWFHHE